MALLTLLFVGGLVTIYAGLAVQPSLLAAGLILAGAAIEVGLVWSLS